MQNLLLRYKKITHDYFLAFYNLFIFLPYFFSVTNLIKTLFSPWKHLVDTKKTVGFSFERALDRFFFNSISRLIGAVMRSSILLFYFFVQLIYILFLPVLAIGYFFLTPFVLAVAFFKKTDEQKKEKEKEIFSKQHLLKQENEESVNQWFEDYYHMFFFQTEWWRIKNLFSIPPLTRDWSYGFTPDLERFSENLSSSSYYSKRKTIIDRTKEVEQIIQALSKSEETNVLVVGEEGVGKHTIIDALAKKIYEGATRSLLNYKRILKLDMEKILSQDNDQKQREFFLEELFTEASDAGNIILVIDDFHRYLDYTVSISKFAKTSKVQFIGITTPFMYQKYIYNNEKINQMFEKVSVFEINKNEARKILLDAALFFEKQYCVIIPYETVENAIEKSDYFITSIPFPEKAIELLDLTCAGARESKIVLPEQVDAALKEKMHIETRLTDELRQKLLALQKLLKDSIVHQDNAVDALASALQRSFALMGKRKKPLASFLFLGPTGVGKTETAKVIARVFFGSEKNLIRFDMSLYQSKNSIPELIDLFSRSIRENPFGVLLLDEVEKADKELLNVFLTVLDEGYLTDSYGKRVDCKNLVIIATSNARTSGSQFYEGFSPEFLNRFDGIVVYKPLDKKAIAEVAQKIIKDVVKDIYDLHKITVHVSDELIERLATRSYNPAFGARDMERLIRQEIEEKIAKLIIENKAKEGSIIQL